MTHKQKVGIQRALVSFFEWAKLHEPHDLKIDGELGPKTHALVHKAMFYLGYPYVRRRAPHFRSPRTEREWSRLVRRLRHPKSRWLSPAALLRGLRRRRARRRAVRGSTLHKAEELLRICQKFSGSYRYGGGHGVPMSQLGYSSNLDCSSSTSLALKKAGLYEGTYAEPSGGYWNYGLRGRGKYVTIHYNGGHIWMEFSIPGHPYSRFDTSPHGCGGRGPRVRYCSRSSWGFNKRHPRGL